MKLQGIVVPMITPLTEAGMLDCAGLEKLTNHLIDGGCAALFGLGTTGEGPFLSSSQLEKPLCVNGYVEITVNGKQRKLD